MPITNQLLDQLLEGCSSPDDILGESGLLKQLTKKVAERALETEMEAHLGYAKHEAAGKNTGNSRNGKSRKCVRSVHGEIELEVPRDRNGSFEPKLVKKGEKQLHGFDERIVSLYARGMTTRDIQAHFQDAYGVEVSPTFISQVTNAVMDEVSAWQNRPLDALYVSWKQRKAVAADLRAIYAAATLAEAERALDDFAEKWDEEHPTISRSWRANWERLSVFFDYPPQIRKVIYTTNAIESVNASLRKVTKTRRSFPTDESVMKVLYLALHQISRKWTMPIRDWKQAMSQFTILFGDRIAQ